MMPGEGVKMSNRPPLHPDWAAERNQTRNKGDWRKDLLTRIAGISQWAAAWATWVGSGLHETQIRFDKPVNSLFSFDQLDLVWVQFKVWEPNTKNPGTRVVRFGPDVGAIFCVVKVPREDGTFEYYCLARQKYQLGGKDLFFEFTRGWVPGSTSSDRGAKLLERDFPGISRSPLVSEIKQKELGHPIFENNAEFCNLLTSHLMVITLAQGVSIDDFYTMLVTERARAEYENISPLELDPEFLKVKPVLMELGVAAKHLNAQLTGLQGKKAFFGENYSMGLWTRFLALHGWQFPELFPEKGEEI
jgi:hypothetical protein